MNAITCVFLALFLGGVWGQGGTLAPGKITVTNVERTVDLSSQLVRVTSKINFENSGSTILKNFFHGLDDNTTPNLAFVSAVDSANPDKKLAAVRVGDDVHTYLDVTLGKNVGPNEKGSIVVTEVYRNMLVPYPKEIKQSEPQLVTYDTNIYYLSPYTVKEQTTIFVLASKNVISYTKIEPYNLNEKEIEYGPFENIAPFSVSKIAIHTENNSPFLTVKSLVRWVEVSHWGGNIAVEETIKIQHSGAKLDGSFSRFDFMYMRATEGIPVVKNFKTILPAGANDVYYRDEIGNISTSNMLKLMNSVELEIRPRYPLFGGWETHYMLGYNLPSYQYLFRHGSEHALKMRFVDHVFDEMSIDEVIVKVILPEGSTDVKLKAPYGVKREEDSLHHTYLDTTGRPVITLTKTDVVVEHIQDFELRYQYSSINLLREPILLIGGLFILFFTVIIVVRMDFSISVDSAAESKLRVGGAVDQLMAFQNKREALYSRLEDAIASYRKTKDNASLSNERKGIENQMKDIRSSVDQLSKSLKDSNDTVDKINEVQRLEATHWNCINESMSNASKVVGAAITVEQFKKLEEANEAKKNETRGKIARILGSL